MLCSITSSDAEALLRLHTDPDVRAFLGGALPCDEARRKVDSLLVGQRRYPAWAIRSAGDGASLLGLVSLDLHHDGNDVEISYLLLPEHQGRGHAVRAVTEALRYAFDVLRLTRVVAETQSANVRSIWLLERVGMVFERHVVRFGAEQSIYATSAHATGSR